MVSHTVRALLQVSSKFLSLFGVQQRQCSLAAGNRDGSSYVEGELHARPEQWVALLILLN